ncbi:MAG TPA: dihydrofolate reductase [Acholeplasmataceae bacterium]|nr:dihydrofolate reductase [Acholeplasmataceae bacterium]
MINIIVAISKNNVIGKNNDIPWHYPEDLKYFKKVTMGKKVLMGSKTFQSIINRLGKPLPGRTNIVVTRNETFSYPGVIVINDLEKYLKDEKDEIFIIGGSSIYSQTLPFADKLYITHIDKDFDGDTFFPEVNYQNYDLIEKRVQGELTFCIYQRSKVCVH